MSKIHLIDCIPIITTCSIPVLPALGSLAPIRCNGWCIGITIAGGHPILLTPNTPRAQYSKCHIIPKAQHS